MDTLSTRISGLRTDYRSRKLDESHVSADPIEQLKTWLEEALSAEVHEPNAMVLSTVNAEGQPSARVVLLRGLEDRGLAFFTNYQSRKGQELLDNDKVALTFFWPELERQIRVEGVSAMVSTEESDNYFHSRPPTSQIGAWASAQSQPLKDREELEQAVKDFEAKYGTGDIPRPKHWGGYRVKPHRIEFWQGRASRLHDRLSFERDGDSWNMVRLSP